MIRCQNVTIKYDNVVAVSNVNFSLEKGDYLFVIGENGGGKSSLVKAILGLIRVSEGEITTGCGSVGYLSQQTLVQNDFPASAYEIVLSGCVKKAGLFYKKEHKLLAAEKIRELGIYDIRHKSFRDLSGGQKQRVLLARALCASDELLILDEPTTGLDPKVTAELYEALRELNRNNNLTIIMVSHDIRAAIKYAGKILHIEREPVFFGTKDDYIKSGKIDKFFGGKPF